MTYMLHHLSGKPPFDRHEIFIRKMVQKGIHPTMQLAQMSDFGDAVPRQKVFQKLTNYQQHLVNGWTFEQMYKKK